MTLDRDETMLKYKKTEIDGNKLIYQYIPDGTGKPGKVSIDKRTGETAVIEVSDDDIGNRYAFKLLKRLSEFFAENNYKDDGIIAWY